MPGLSSKRKRFLSRVASYVIDSTVDWNLAELQLHSVSSDRAQEKTAATAASALVFDFNMPRDPSQLHRSPSSPRYVGEGRRHRNHDRAKGPGGCCSLRRRFTALRRAGVGAVSGASRRFERDGLRLHQEAKLFGNTSSSFTAGQRLVPAEHLLEGQNKTGAIPLAATLPAFAPHLSKVTGDSFRQVITIPLRNLCGLEA